MNNPRTRSQRLRLILGKAHQAQKSQAPQPDPDWRKRLMNSLPSQETKPYRADQWAFMERLVWRFVPAAGALALFMVFLVGQIGPDSNIELASLLSSDTLDSGLYSYYQSER